MPDPNAIGDVDTATINVGELIAVIWPTEDGQASVKLKLTQIQTADPGVAYTIVGQQQ